MFEPRFNEQEQEMVDKISKRGRVNISAVNGLLSKVEYVKNGNFTYAVVQTENGMFVGGAKRNPNDTYVPEIGEAVAFKRAISFPVEAERAYPTNRQFIRKHGG